MDAQKFTQKSLEAIQSAQNIALSHQSMQIEQEHLLSALIEQNDGLIPQLLMKMGVDWDGLRTALGAGSAPCPASRAAAGSRTKFTSPWMWTGCWPTPNSRPPA